MLYVSEFLSHVVDGRGHSKATADSYRKSLLDLERTLGVEDPRTLTIRDLDSYMTKLSLRGASQATRRTRAYGIRSFFWFLKSRGLIEANPALEFRAPFDKANSISTFTEDEIRRLVFAPEPEVERSEKESDGQFMLRKRRKHVTFRRDSALLGLLYCLGLRVSDVKGLRLDALRWSDRGLALDLSGKAAREPTPVFVDPSVALLVQEYILAAREYGIRHPALFAPIGLRKGTDQPPLEQGIGQNRICSILLQRCRETGVSARGRKISPHIFRYTLATHLYDAGLDPRRIQIILRHRSIETTLKYIRLAKPAGVQKAAIKFLPWNRQGTRFRKRPAMTPTEPWPAPDAPKMVTP